MTEKRTGAVQAYFDYTMKGAYAVGGIFVAALLWRLAHRFWEKVVPLAEKEEEKLLKGEER